MGGRIEVLIYDVLFIQNDMNSDSNDKLINPTIKGLDVNCFVVTEEQLQNQKQNSIFGDIFWLFGSILIGAAASNKFPENTLLLLLIGLLLLILGILFRYLKDNLIKRLKKRPSIIDIEKTNEIKIIKATYGIDMKIVDVTEKIINNLIDNKLEMKVSNENLGINKDNDPAIGKHKELEVLYLFNGNIVTKNGKEYEIFTIP